MRWFALVLVVALIAAVTWSMRPGSTSEADAAAVTASNGSDDGIDTANDAIAPQSIAGGMSEPLPANAAEALARLESQKARDRAEVDKVLAAGRNKLVGRYESETTDQSWANAKQVELAQFSTSAQIEAINVEPGNLDIACRRSICRIGADFASRSAAQDWATLYLTNMGDRLPNAFFEMSANTDGSTHIDVYGLARR